MVKVFKEKDYQGDIPDPTIQLEDFLISGLEGLRANVIESAKKFPIRNTLAVIGFLTVLYIGFKVGRKFVKI